MIIVVVIVNISDFMILVFLYQIQRGFEEFLWYLFVYFFYC